MQSPGPVPKKADFDPKFSLVEEKKRAIKITPVPKPKEHADKTDAAVMKPLGPGQYKEEDNGRKYLAKTQIVHMIAKQPKKSFIDFARDSRKWVPSSAHYKVDPNIFKLLSKSPVS